MSNFTTDYFVLKTPHPDHLIFYRIGGFYELYFDDAITASKALSIVLNHKKINGENIPTCGFPVKSLHVFSNKLLELGFKIAIAEQFISPDDPKKFTRKVSKILTPGTVVGDENILLSLVQKGEKFDVCFGNILMGEFYLDEVEENQINGYLEAIKPAEILRNFVNSDFKIDNPILKILSRNNNLALKPILEYIASIHGLEIIQHLEFHQYKNEEYLKISPITIRNLRLDEAVKMLDKTNCDMGKRLLKSAITKPLVDVEKIEQRLDAVEFLLNENSLLETLKNHLQALGDLEKTINKISINKNANFADLALILQSLQTFAKIAEIFFHQNNSKKLPEKLGEISRNLIGDFALINLLKLAIEMSPLSFPPEKKIWRESRHYLSQNWIPAKSFFLAGMTNIIKLGFNSKLDNWKNLLQENLQKISDLEKEQKIKIEFSEIVGFYFEIKREKLVKFTIPKDWQIIQDLEKSVRFTCEDLKKYQLEIADLNSKIKALEEEILQELITEVLKNISEIKNGCKAIGFLDLLTSFAVLAKENNYIKPIITNQNQIKILGGKHVISSKFIANDCDLTYQRIWLITGSNMAGKSTFLRQNILIVILAQIGCFVPAIHAEIGVRKQIFAKMISEDNLQNHISSFMAEMLEMAEILAKADEKSLIIIDELCQATNSGEGELIAYNIIKYLQNHNKSLSLISTHHLNLPAKFQDTKNIICKKIDKTHRITDGIAKESGALEIAKQAGLPFIIYNS